MPKPILPWSPSARRLNRWHRLLTHAGNQGPLGVTWERSPSASGQFTFRTNLVSVTQRFGAGDAEVGQRAAVAHRDLRAPAAPQQKAEQRLCTVYLVVSLLKLMIGDLMMFLDSPSVSRSSKIHTATDTDHKSFHKSTVPHELLSLSSCWIVVVQGMA